MRWTLKQDQQLGLGSGGQVPKIPIGIVVAVGRYMLVCLNA